MNFSSEGNNGSADVSKIAVFPASIPWNRINHFRRKVEAAVHTAVHSTLHRPADKIRFYLLFSVMCPLFLAAEAIPRFFMLVMADGTKPRVEQRSAYGAAKENTYIAISYAFMARSELQKFARQTRTERLS
jgi:hypothetical protein